MASAKVDISGGQVSGVSDLSSAPTSVVNFDVDESGTNWPRAALVSYSVTGLRSEAINGLFRFGSYTIIAYTSGYLQAISDATPTTAVDLSTSTATTQVQGGARPVFVAGRNYVYVTAGYQIVYWGPGMLTAATISASPRCTHIASLGQYLIANDLDNLHAFRWSDIGEGTWGTWSAANTTNPAAKPDPVVGLTATLDELHVFGSETTQIYQVGSDPTLPFDLVTTTNIGIEAPYAYAEIDDGIAMLDHRRRFIVGGSPISDAIQRDLRGLSDISDAWVYRVEEGQFAFLVLRFPASDRTFVWDLKAQRWAEYRFYEAPFSRDYPAGGYCYIPALNYHIIGSEKSTGGLFRLSRSVRTEASSAPVVCERTTGWHDFDSDAKKRFSRLRVVIKRGAATDDDASDQGALELRVQDDDSGWSDWAAVPIGSASQFENAVDVWDLAGIGRRRRYGIRYSSAEETAIASVSQHYEELST